MRIIMQWHRINNSYHIVLRCKWVNWIFLSISHVISPFIVGKTGKNFSFRLFAPKLHDSVRVWMLITQFVIKYAPNDAKNYAKMRSRSLPLMIHFCTNYRPLCLINTSDEIGDWTISIRIMYSIFLFCFSLFLFNLILWFYKVFWFIVLFLLRKVTKA